ncbi:hypothetical protein PIB30_078789 [Stylosanthes scabra]|uniref:Uncharacterized protein n=1 Tax=Stylosanthes scabra TaxID=79078 RepID=A0ABU6WQN0_9FABA|nr:hypothetical protein [Stylosanthes scabra]
MAASHLWCLEARTCHLPSKSEKRDSRHQKSTKGQEIQSGNKYKQTLSFDPEIEKTLHKLRKQAKFQEHSHEIPFEETFEEEFEDKTGDSMASNEDNNRGRKLADFSIPSAASCGSSVVRPAVDVNNFELKPSLIQLV